MIRRTVLTSARLWVASVAVASCAPELRVGDGVRGDAADADASTVAPDAPRADAGPVPIGGPCARDGDCDDGRYCDGVERCVAGVCAAGEAPCDDRIVCTRDGCDEATRACHPEPDDAACVAPHACNGPERCHPGGARANALTGCEPIDPSRLEDCDDANTCTIDTCDPTAGCLHTPRDLDGDGYVDRACTIDGTPTGPPGDDCNDADPTVYPGAPEVCNDGRDNNCDGLIDYADPRCIPANDSCATAARLAGAGGFVGSTTGLRNTLSLSCNPGEFADAVFEFTIASAQDVAITTAVPPGASAAVTLLDSCGPPPSEVRCVRAPFGASPSLHARALMPGRYRVVVETGTGTGPFRLNLRFDPPTSTPLDEACPAVVGGPAVELADGMPHVAHLAALDDDYTLACGTSARPDAVYRLTVATPAALTLTASAATGAVYMSFRNSPCQSSASERQCVAARVLPPTAAVIESRLAAGTYWVMVEQSSDQDVTVTARLMP